MITTTHDDWQELGYTAFKSGVEWTDSPCPPNSAADKSWQGGWLTAQREARAAAEKKKPRAKRVAHEEGTQDSDDAFLRVEEIN